MTRASLVLVVWLLFLHYGQPPRNTIYWNTLFDAGHALGFGAVTWALDRMLRRRYPGLGSVQALLSSALLALAVGAASELAQLFDARRHASLGDLGRDAAGIIGFAAIRGLRRSPRPSGARRVALSGLLVAAGGVALSPWLAAVAAYRQRDAAFPIVVPFEPRWERAFLTTNLSSRLPLAPAAPGVMPGMVRFRLAHGRYPGFSVDELAPDWRTYDRLEFDAVVTGTSPLTLVLRVHDEPHTGDTDDRFNRTLTLHPGWQQISIRVRDIEAAPLGRRLDLAEIRGLSLFAPVLDAPIEIYLTPLRLRRTG